MNTIITPPTTPRAPVLATETKKPEVSSFASFDKKAVETKSENKAAPLAIEKAPVIAPAKK